MAKNVIIHMPRVGENLAHWAVSDDKGVLASDIFTGTLEQAAAKVEGRRCTLVLPGDDVLLAEAHVPGGSSARAVQAVPFQLEELVADDVDELHFALGSKSKDDNYPVAVVSRDTMDTVREQCEAAGLRPTLIVPETLALPKFDDSAEFVSWTGLSDGHQTVVRLNGFKGFSTDSDMAVMMLDGATADLPEDVNAAMVLYCTNTQVQPPAFENVHIEKRDVAHRLSLYASGLASAPNINLLQGDYNPKKQFDKTWQPWRWTLGLMALLGVAVVAGKWLDYRATEQRLAQIDSQISAAFKEALPDSRMVRPAKQIETRIEQLRGGNIGGFTSKLGEIGASLATQEQTVVRSISFREGRFDLDVNTDAIPTLDLLASELSKRGSMSMKVQSANGEKGGIRSRIRIE